MKHKIPVLSMILLAVSFTCQGLAFAQEARIMNHKTVGSSSRSLPDLRVRGVQMGDPTIGGFKVIVQNIGKAKASSCQLRLWIKDQNGKTAVLVEVNQPPLEAGGFASVKIPGEKPLGAYWKYEIMTDSSSKVVESNEGNNIWVSNTGKV